MAINKQIQDFPSTTAVNPTDLFHLQQGGEDKKIQAQDLLSVTQGGGAVKVDKLINGLHFTSGVSTTISLSQELGSKRNAWIFFDGIYQEKETYELSGVVITFNDVIPEGVTGIEVVMPIVLDIGATSADNVSFSSANSVEDLLKQNIVFNTVQEMIDATWLQVGMKCKTLGYYSSGDGGGNDYSIVSNTVGIVDGGSYIALSTHRAEGLFLLEFNIKQFGAIADSNGTAGNGTDNTTAIQNLVNFIPNGATIIIPAVTDRFRVTGQIECSSKRVRFIGKGRGSKLFFDNPTGAQSLFRSENSNTYGIIVEYLDLLGNRSDAVDNEFDGVVLECVGTGGVYIRDAAIRHCYVNGFGSCAYLELCDSAEVYSNRFENMATSAVNASLCSMWTCRNSRIENNVQETRDGAYSILLNDRTNTTVGSDVVISGNTLLQEVSLRYHKQVVIFKNKLDYENRDAFGGALLVTNGMEEVYILSNHARGADGNITGTGNEGGVFRITDGAKHILVAHNILKTYGGIGDGMSLNGIDPSEPIIIVGNTVEDETGTSVKVGIFLQEGGGNPSRQSLIFGNTVKGFSEGIKVQEVSKHSSIVLNSCLDQLIRAIDYATTAAGDGEAIICNNFTNGIIRVSSVNDLLVCQNRGRGILIEMSDRCAVIANSLKSISSLDPFIQVEGDDCDVKSNNLWADGTGPTGGSIGIYCTSSADGGSVIGNTIMGFSQANATSVRISGAGKGVLVDSNRIDNSYTGIRVDNLATYNTGGGNMITNPGAGGATSIDAGAILTGTMF